MLHAISPIDGRYYDKTKDLSPYFSEYALIRYRVWVEVKYFNFLCEKNIFKTEDPSAIISKTDTILNDFSEIDAQKIKEIERTTNHDVKAVEYFLREKFTEVGLNKYIEFIHFGLTSQDINNTAFPLMLKHAINEIILPKLEESVVKIKSFADEYPETPMLAFTHGQPASPTTLKKEMYVFVERLENQISSIKWIRYRGKFGGATGNFNAHIFTYPDIDWVKFGNEFLLSIGLVRLQTTTQIAHYDNEAECFQLFSRANTILIDFCRDIWMYIAMNYIKQKAVKNEVGSSAMPHKVNPIDFENAEGNLMMANSIFNFLAEKLPISRLQRDLTDSTVLRNIGVPFAHTLIAYHSLLKGINKLSINLDKINSDLENNVAVLAEAIQSILRREGVEHPYELLKSFTRGKSQLTMTDVHVFIDTLPVNQHIKDELKKLTPSTYIGNGF